jgi:hypothetical protein
LKRSGGFCEHTIAAEEALQRRSEYYTLLLRCSATKCAGTDCFVSLHVGCVFVHPRFSINPMTKMKWRAAKNCRGAQSSRSWVRLGPRNHGPFGSGNSNAINSVVRKGQLRLFWLRLSQKMRDLLCPRLQAKQQGADVGWPSPISWTSVASCRLESRHSECEFATFCESSSLFWVWFRK